jgi:radical SAM-linked protein
MIGLPVPGGATEEARAIVEFFDRLLARVPMQLNVNVGTFVPKPHTPFQWSSQVSEDEALEAIRFMKDGLRRHRNLKLSYHSPFVSVLEGVISRGDERVGGLILEAYRRGARLDAWEDHFDRELWRGVLDTAGWNVVGETLAGHSLEASLPWDDIAIRVGKKYLAEEFERSKEALLTSRCEEKCNKPCGACSDSVDVVDFSEHIEVPVVDSEPSKQEKIPMRLVFSFAKTGIGRYYPHLSIAEAFSRAFLMLGLPVQYSEGFNPMPRLELVQPLPLGYGSQAEYGNLMLTRPLLATTSPAGPYESNELLKRINAKLPEGLEVTRLGEYPIREGKKIYSLASLSWGSRFTIGSRMDAGMALQDLNEAMSKRIGELGLAGACSCILPDGRLSVSLPDPKSKDAGLMRVLESCMESRPIQSFLDIGREDCLATAPGGFEKRDYFSVFEELAKGS